MLKRLKLRAVGPAPSLDLELASRVNLITGDNGLGKSFLLDIAWWALTRTWAHYPALPDRKAKNSPQIAFEIEGRRQKGGLVESTFDWPTQRWKRPAGRPLNPGMVLYAKVDGSFSVWDPARNDGRAAPTRGVDGPARPPAYHFSAAEVWDGVERPGTADKERTEWLCNGLLRDWASWQRENGVAFTQFCSVLSRLSPSPSEPLTPGELTRISLDDLRDMPTLRVPYAGDVAIVHASAAVRRVVSLAYLLVWTWQEHQRASALLKQEPTDQVTFLIDEIEAHLHPAWQRRILPSLLGVVRALAAGADTAVQLIAVTHSPMLLASVEPIFDQERDALWMLDLIHHGGTAEVRLSKDAWHRRGDASAWLRSEIFDLKEARSVEAERALEAARAFMRANVADRVEFDRLYNELRRSMPGDDPFWVDWRAWGWRQGLVGEERA